MVKRKRRKNRLLTDALREIWHTRSRFLSILVLSALAVAFLSGLRTTAPDMEYTADNYYDATHLMDGYVLSTLGLVEEDLAALSAAPGIAAVEGGYNVDAVAEDSIVIVRSLPEEINLLTVEEGRLPERPDECVTEELLLLDLGLEIGDTLSIVPGEDNADALARQEYTIVGTVRSPLYVSTDRGTSSLGTGSVSAYVYIPAENFTWDYYTVVFFTGDGLTELDGYSDEYDDQVESLVDSLDGLAEERAQLRQDSLVGEAQAEIDDARAELDDAKAEAEQELADAAQELADARKELDDGWREYYDGLQEFQDGKAEGQQELDDGQKELDDALAELNDGEADLADARKELDDGWDDYYAGYQEYQDGLDEFEEGYQDYLDGVEAYEEGLAEYEDGRRQLNRALTQLNDGEAEYATGKEQFDQFVQTYLLPYTSYETAGALGNALVAEGTNTAGPVHQAVTSAISSLRSQISALRTAISQLDMLLASKADLEAANIPQMQSSLESLNTQIPLLEQQIAQLSPDDPTLPGLQQQLAELKQQQAALEVALNGDGTEENPGLLAQQAAVNAGIAAIEQGLAGQGLTVDDARALLDQLSAVEEDIPADAEAVRSSYSQLLSARQELDDGWDEYYDGSAQLRAAKRQLDEAEEQLDEAEEEIDAGQAELDEAKAELDDAKQQLQDGEADYAEGRQELDDGWRDYYDGVQELADGKAEFQQEIADGQAELDEAYRDLQDGEAEYAEGLQDYEDGKAEADREIGEAEDKLAEAQWELDDLDDCEWYVLSRNTNVGVVGYSQDAERVSNLADIFPIIFFLVAALACLTTMTRMVDEQRTQIGSLKALGFGRAAISIKYIGYAFSASFLGGMLGLLVGCTLIPLVIANAFNIMYAIPALEFLPQPGICILAVAAAVVCTTGAAVWACASTLMDSPASLMRPRSPKAGKRVFLERIRPVWRRLSFTWKVTMRNLFRYQRRFWMTVIGIGGCTALIVTGFGLHNSIFDILDKQFDEIFLYDATVGLEEHLTDRQRDLIASYLNESEAVERWLPSYQESLDASSDSRTVEGVTLFAVAGQEDFSQFVHLRHRQNNAPATLPQEGVVLSEKLSELLDVGVGDTIILDGESRVTAPVAEIVENYVQHYVYLTEDYYTQLFGAEIHDNVLLLAYGDNTAAVSDQVSTELMAMNGVASYSYIATIRDTFTESMNSVDYAVIIIIVAAAALAFVVLYNLTNINITERIRELATLKVLGFYDGEVSAYVYRENIFLTLFGIFLGLWMGRLLHSWLVLTVEVDMVMFGRTAPPYAYVLAALLTVVFSLAVNAAAHFKLRKVDMVESLKSVE